MAVFQLGPIIRNRREELHLSQEDLADGICSVPTLSRIENGERMPTKNHFEMLMQRLGYSAMSLDYFTDKKDFMIHELKFKIRHEYITKNFPVANSYLKELNALLDSPTDIDRQFVILHEVLINEDQYTNIERLHMLEDAILITCPKYKENSIPKILSYDEIILLNNIAICHEEAGNRSLAVKILFALENYYDQHMISEEEALRTQPMILYNLSKYLGLSGRFDECIKVCDVGIRLANVTGRCPLLSETLFNRAWALVQRNQPGDLENAKATLLNAICFANIIDKKKNLQAMKNYYISVFGETGLV